MCDKETLDVCGLYTEEIDARILRKGREDMGERKGRDG